MVKQLESGFTAEFTTPPSPPLGLTENRILRNQIKGRIRLSESERKALTDIGQKLGKQALQGGLLSPGQYLIHDRNTKFCAAFQQIIDDASVERVVLPPRSPNLNAYAERQCMIKLLSRE